MARRRKGRDVHGILLLDKPAGFSSNAALQKVKWLYQAKKAGHTGSLDNLATGLLPICLGEATKLSAFLLDADKRYQATCRLGISTTTADAEGEVLEERPVPDLSAADLEAVLARFVGPQQQLPPMYSALKYQGQPLYKLARQGKEVEREPRPITIYALELLSLDLPSFSIEVSCSKGTYIRTLAEDIGKVLGCGAHVSALRRIGVGAYSDMIALETLQETAENGGFEALDALLNPLEGALPEWPEVRVPAALETWLKQGQAVQIPRAPTEGLVKLLGSRGQLLGIGKILDNGLVAPKRVLQIET